MQVRRGDEAARDLDLLLAELKIDIIPVSGKQAQLARKAFQRLVADDIRQSLTLAIASHTRLPRTASSAAFQGQRFFPDGHYDSGLLTSVPAGF